MDVDYHTGLACAVSQGSLYDEHWETEGSCSIRPNHALLVMEVVEHDANADLNVVAPSSPRCRAAPPCAGKNLVAIKQ